MDELRQSEALTRITLALEGIEVALTALAVKGGMPPEHEDAEMVSAERVIKRRRERQR